MASDQERLSIGVLCLITGNLLRSGLLLCKEAKLYFALAMEINLRLQDDFLNRRQYSKIAEIVLSENEVAEKN